MSVSCDCCLSSHIKSLIACDSIAIEHTKELVAMKRRQSSDIRSFFNKKAAQEDSGKPGSSLDLYLLGYKIYALFIHILGPSNSDPEITVRVPVTQLHSISSDDEDLDQPVIPVTPMINQQSNALLSEPPPFEDIGNLLEPTKSIDTICQSVSDLSNEAKYSLLCHHISPPNILPTTYSGGCNRKFNTTWLTKYPFLLYSPKLDGVFCRPCSLFLSSDKRKDKGLLVNRSYSNWSKIGNALSNHSSLLYHLDCVQYTDNLKNSIDNPASRIDVMANSDIQMQMDENRHIVRQIVRAIPFLGKQGLPFRGDNEDLNITKNPGNILALLKCFSESDSILFDHLNKPRSKNATYISPRSQNEIINVIGHDII